MSYIHFLSCGTTNMSFLSGKFHSGIFGKKEDKKAPVPEPKPGMFSGLAVKQNAAKSVQNNTITSGYSPPFMDEPNISQQSPPAIQGMEVHHARKSSQESSSSSHVDQSLGKYQDTASTKSVPLGMIDVSSNRGSSRISDTEIRNQDDPFAMIQFETKTEAQKKKVDIPMTFKTTSKQGSLPSLESSSSIKSESKKADIPMTFKQQHKKAPGFDWSDEDEEQFRQKSEAAKKEKTGLGGGLPSFNTKKSTKDSIPASPIKDPNEPVMVFKSTSSFDRFDNENILRLEREKLAREKEAEDERLAREEQLEREKLQKEKVRQDREKQEKLEKQKEIERKVQERLRKEQEEKERKERELRQKQEEERKRRELYQDPNALQQMISEKLDYFDNEIEVRNKKHEMMTEMQLQGIQEIKALEEEIKETEEKQAEAAYNEEFELAEQFNEVLEGLHRTIEYKKEELKLNSVVYSQLEDEKSQVYEAQFQFLEELINECSHISQDEESSLNNIRVEFAKSEEEKTEELKKKRVELNAKQEQATALIDENKIKKSEIEEKIYSQTQDLQEERKVIQDKVTQLDHEIEELLRLLAEKQEAKRLIENNLEQINDKIGVYAKNFEAELYEINDEEEKLVEYNNELLEEQHQLEEEEQQLCCEIQQGSQNIQDKVHKVQLYQECLESLRVTQQTLTSTLQSRLSYLKEIKDLEQLIATKEAEITEAERYKVSVKSEIETTQHTLIRYDERLHEIEIKIPKLESDKKVAASSKQFKEAGKLAAEIKSLSLEQEEIASQMSKLRSEISCKEAELEEVDKSASEINQEIITLREQLEQAKEKLLKLLNS
jgi:hypothetical protein